MASTSQTKDHRFSFTSKSTHFFKIILNDQNDKLAIPRKFGKKYGNDWPSKAVLEVPTGAVWQVELSKSDDGGIWFHRGWKEFADFYSLRKGHFLVFRYENKNRFHVLVFDMSAAEIDYPLTKVTRDEDLKSGVPEDTPPCKKKTRGRPRKMLKTDIDIQHVNKEELGEDVVPIEIPEDTPSSMKRSRGRPRKRLSTDTPPCTKRSRGRPRKMLSTDTPPCKKRSRGRPRKRLNTDTIDEQKKSPSKDLETPCTGDTEETGEADDVSIEILEDIPPCKKKSRRKSPIICSRPQKMLTSNTIDESQREITNRGSRDIYNELECQEQAEILSVQNLTTEEMAKALEIASEYKSKNPLFVVIVQELHLGYKNHLGIPSNFARKHLKVTPGGGTEATLCLSEGERIWSAKYYHTAYNRQTRAQFIYGWREFALDNRLQAGDVCVFELIKNTLRISFKVAIHRLEQAANCLHPSQADNKSRGHVYCKGSKSDLMGSEKACMSNGDSHEPGRFRLNDGNKDQKFVPLKVERRINNQSMDNKGVDAAGAEVTDEASTPKNPYLERVIISSNFSKGNLYVPIDFIDKHLEPNVEQVMLQLANADGQQWPVNLKRYPGQGKLSGGFRRFAEENCLKAGDVCVFELIVPRKAIFKVTIKRGQSQSNPICLVEN